MIRDNVGLFEMGLSAAAVLGFLIYQYWATSRSQTHAQDNEQATPDAAPTPESPASDAGSIKRAGHPEREHGLHDR